MFLRDCLFFSYFFIFYATFLLLFLWIVCFLSFFVFIWIFIYFPKYCTTLLLLLIKHFFPHVSSRWSLLLFLFFLCIATSHLCLQNYFKFSFEAAKLYDILTTPKQRYFLLLNWFLTQHTPLNVLSDPEVPWLSSILLKFKNTLHFVSFLHFDFTAHLDLIKHSLSSGREIFPGREQAW